MQQLHCSTDTLVYCVPVLFTGQLLNRSGQKLRCYILRIPGIVQSSEPVVLVHQANEVRVGEIILACAVDQHLEGLRCQLAYLLLIPRRKYQPL